MNNLTTLIKARKTINAKIAAARKAKLKAINSKATAKATAAKRATLLAKLKSGSVVTLKTINRNEMVKTVNGIVIWHRYRRENSDETGWNKFTVQTVYENSVVLNNGNVINKEYIRTIKNDPVIA
jgi:hypothetical protein